MRKKSAELEAERKRQEAALERSSAADAEHMRAEAEVEGALAQARAELKKLRERAMRSSADSDKAGAARVAKAEEAQKREQARRESVEAALVEAQTQLRLNFDQSAALRLASQARAAPRSDPRSCCSTLVRIRLVEL